MMTDHSSDLKSSSTASIARSTALHGDIKLPGDKSISHRAAMISALGNGITTIENYSSAVDCQNTLDCLARLGVSIERNSREAGSWTVHGGGPGSFRPPTAMLDAGNSGTTMRLLSGILAGLPFTTEIGGDESLSRRPMRRVIEPLERMGAAINSRDDGFAPLRISGGNLHAIDYQPPVASAQVKSCVLLAGLFAEGITTVTESIPTRNHTEIMLEQCGAHLSVTTNLKGSRISIDGTRALAPLGDYEVAGDLSSAAFFIASALLVPNSELVLRTVGANPSRIALVEVLQKAGAGIIIENMRMLHGEPVSDIIVRHSRLEGRIELSGSTIANLIDEIPILAVLATRIDGGLRVQDAKELRVKECDRIHAIVANLRKMGIEIDEFPDGFRIDGGQQLRGAVVQSFNDHRIAMAFAVAGLIAEGETVIEGAEAASVSLPEFFDLLSSCGASIAIS